MKKSALLIVLLGTAFAGKGQWSVPQLQAGVYVHDTSFETHTSFPGLCAPFAEYTICLDTNLIPIVTGVYSELIIFTLTNPGTVYSDQTGIINLYDSLIFTTTNHCFSFHYTASGILEFAFVIAGTPTIPFENYPCSLQDTFYNVPVGQCILYHSNLFASQFICSVDNFNAIKEQNQNEAYSIYPNPAKDELTINLPGFKNLEDLKKEIVVTDILGKEIYRNQITSSNFQFQVSNFQPGIYFIEINNGKNIFRKKFLKE